MALKLRIGDAAAFRRPEDWSITPDDRQEKHQTIDGVVVEDYGHVDAGGCDQLHGYSGIQGL